MGQEEYTCEPAAIPCHLNDMGRDAMNLVEFPLALLADRAPKGCKTLVFEDRIQDRVAGGYVTRRLTVSGSDRFGLPTALDDEVSLGLVQLTKADNFTSRRVPFNRYQLLRILGWRDEGKSYARLDKSLKRWTGVTLYYENAWRDNRDKRWINASLHLLDEVVLRGRSRPVGRSRGDVPGEPSSYFTWNEVVFESFRAGYLKRFDMDFYRHLELAVAKRIYRFLDKRFHFTNELRFDLASFAYEHVGLSRSYDASQLKRRLSPAVRELEQKAFLAPMPAEQRYRRLCRGKWEIVLVRAPKAISPVASRRPLSVLEHQLAERGVSASTAARLVRDFPAEQIQAKVEVFDAMSKQRNSGTLRNPAGFLVQSIRDNYVSPAGLEQNVRRNRVVLRPAETRKSARNATRPKASGINGLCHVEQSPFAEYLARLSAAERNELEEHAISHAHRIPAEGYRRAMETGNDHLAHYYRQVIVEQHLKETLHASAA
jgi:hypothetical protein